MIPVRETPIRNRGPVGGPFGIRMCSLDMCFICFHHYHMSTMIQIRNVPKSVHKAAKARAAMEGLTLSDFALAALREAVEKPTLAEISARIRLLEPVESPPPMAEMVRTERDAR